LLTAAENVTAVGSVAVLIGPSAAIVIASPPASAPLPKVKIRLETLALVSIAEHTMAETVRITTDLTAAAALHRFRVCGGYGSRAKGYGDSKTESVFAHSLVLSLVVCIRRAIDQHVANRSEHRWSINAPFVSELLQPRHGCSLEPLMLQTRRATLWLL
jgi:hypothetical protein